MPTSTSATRRQDADQLLRRFELGGVPYDRLDLGHEPAGVVTRERSHDAEHGLAEAAHVQDVTPLRRLAKLGRKP